MANPLPLSSRHLILSLDVHSSLLAQTLVDGMMAHLAMVKVGHVALSSVSSSAIATLLGTMPMMLDLKFHDIPHTVLDSIAGYDVLFPSMELFTFHGSMDVRTLEAIASYGGKSKGVAVLVLSSALVDIPAFLSLARINHRVGIRHFICPPVYIAPMRDAFGSDISLYSPGVRAVSSIQDDHAHTQTTKACLDLGTNFVIVGRPLLNPLTFHDVLQEYVYYG